MKKILLYFLFIISLNSFAQLSRPHFISLNFGTNIPLADYKQLDSISIGNANTGLYYSFEGGAYFSKILGVALNVGAFSNSVNEDDIIAQVKRDIQFKDDKLTVNSDNWVNGYIMVGPIMSFGTEKFIIDLKVLGGIMNTAKPPIEVSSETDMFSINRSNEVTSSNFGLNYGLHLRLKLVKKLGLRINAEGFMSSQEFETKVQETDINGVTKTNTETVKKEIEALNLGIGLILTL